VGGYPWSIQHKELPMTPAELEEIGFAYFLSVEAPNISIDGRYHRRDDFVRIFADRLYYANQTFARKLNGRHSHIATRLVDTLIEKSAMSTSVDQWSVTMHNLDNGRYKAVVKELVESNPICQRAQAAGPRFWEDTFAAIGDDERPSE
jgi:hypothetical protein